MFRSLRLAVAFGLLATLLVGAGTAVAGPGGPNKLVDTRLIGVPNPPLTIAGVPGAGHAWTLKNGNAKLFADGRVDVSVHGLVLFPEGTQPAPTVRVKVSCNGGVGAGSIAQSDLIPLSAKGDMHFNGQLTLVSPCFAPTIFVTTGGASGAWFAVSG